ncbi:AAA family ATPase [Candidatus Woesearchaeota archaeon]|jgi:dephospho-CoA kinase|nr:AAA family ATPase [Candidatus Woesearchaeota archaeon]MBT7237265.1 AAA family ATPase [Candidatus Woesearchaeota archaeon]
MIFGITGYYGSGKDAVAKYLESKGFIHHSLSDEIRFELNKRGMEITRENLIYLGNELRKEHGPSVIAKILSNKLEQDKNYILTSIRNPSEALELKKLENFKLISLDGPIEQRFERVKTRNREEDPKTIEELKEKEKIEESNDETKQQLHKVRDLSDIKINNNSTLEALYDQINSILPGNSYK